MLVIKIIQLQKSCKKKNNFLKILVTPSSINSPPVPLKIAVVISSARGAVARTLQMPRTSQVMLSPYMESFFPVSKVWEEISVFKHVV